MGTNTQICRHVCIFTITGKYVCVTGEGEKNNNLHIG